MISAAIVSFLFGAALGLRFKVIVVVPATAIFMVLFIGFGITHHQTAWWIVGMTACAALCLQFGYFAGIVVMHFLAAEPSRESPPPLAGAKASPRHATR